MTSDCLLISVYLPVFAWCAHKIVLFWPAEQFYEHIMQNSVKTGKYTEINKQSDVKFWLNWKKYGTVSYSFSRSIFFRRTKTISCNSYFLCIRYMDRYCKESFRTLLLDWCLGMIIIRSRQKKISQKQIITCFLTLAQLNTYCMDLQKCDVHNGTITCLKLHFLKKILTVSVLCSI